MTGSAVVTTRLSSAAMNSAIELMAKVQTTWVRAGMIGFLLLSSRLVVRTKKGPQFHDRQASPRKSANELVGESVLRPTAAATFRSMPLAKNRWRSSGDAWEPVATVL